MAEEEGGLNFGKFNFNLAGGAVGDIFGGRGSELKARGNELEAENYREASKFATLEAQIQESTTAVTTAQAQRQVYQGIGQAEASVAGAGFGKGGTAGDILRSSAQQGALQAAVVHQTGQVAEIGFQEQSKAYANMAEASELAAQAQREAGHGSYIMAGLKIAGAIAPML